MAATLEALVAAPYPSQGLNHRAGSRKQSIKEIGKKSCGVGS